MAGLTAEQHVSVPLLRAGWESLTFVHWRVAPEQVQALLPSGLTVDEYEGAAWVGVTPFVMTDMRPLGLPQLCGGLDMVPGLGRMARLARGWSTPETNLRTYVRGPDGLDGLWFLSLDIGNPLLAVALRAAVGAPYHYARLNLEHRGEDVAYTGSRSGATTRSYRLVVRPGAPVVPSGLEIWLTGRWRAYTVHLGRLMVTPVEHEPWPLREATVETIEENLTSSVGLHGMSDPPLVHFSDGVRNVRVGRPAMVRNH